MLFSAESDYYDDYYLFSEGLGIPFNEGGEKGPPLLLALDNAEEQDTYHVLHGKCEIPVICSK